MVQGSFLRFLGGYRKVPGVRRESRGAFPLALVLPLALSSRLTCACPRLKKKKKSKITTPFWVNQSLNGSSSLSSSHLQCLSNCQIKGKKILLLKKNLFNGEKVLRGVRAWHMIETILSICFFVSIVRILTLEEVSQLASSSFFLINSVWIDLAWNLLKKGLLS